ncbi:MAG: hypothetical protein IT318_01205 [Anaerolineales bacterium]|nr:hypothetical protein [Anaerolineales bacterium]
MPNRLRAALLALFAAGLACAVPGLGPTPTPTAVPGYVGRFDCSGYESGLLAYAGRLTFEAGGAAEFKPSGEDAFTGAYTDNAGTLSFSSGFAFSTALYTPGADEVSASVAPGVTLAHAETGTVTCVRAEPGITGPVEP